MALHQTDPIATSGNREGGWSDSPGKISFSVVFQFFLYMYTRNMSQSVQVIITEYHSFGDS